VAKVKARDPPVGEVPAQHLLHQRRLVRGHISLARIVGLRQLVFAHLLNPQDGAPLRRNIIEQVSVRNAHTIVGKEKIDLAVVGQTQI